MSASLAGAPAATIWRGQCVACHGSAGEGNRALGAPALTQLSDEYLGRQLSHFVGGVRGAPPDDAAGKRMALSVANLTQDDIAALANYVSTELPGTRPVNTLKGDTARGQDYYRNLCSACHGGNALGNDLLGAPAQSAFGPRRSNGCPNGSVHDAGEQLLPRHRERPLSAAYHAALRRRA